MTHGAIMAEHEPSPHHRADVQVSQDADKVTLKAPADGVTLSADEAQELASRIFEAAMLSRGEDASEYRREPMQYLRVAAERMDLGGEGADAPPEDPEMGDATSAEIHCWIKDQTAANAMHIAAGSIAEHGWMVLEVLEQKPATRADFDGEYLQYFEQALIDSEVFLYELEEPEGDE
jgi:hypothetical protein